MDSNCELGSASDDVNEQGLPPGFRFHPTDDELISFYLASKTFNNNNANSTGIHIADVDLNRCEPWDLPESAKVGEREWYLFSPRDRKYPTGLRTNRATGAGYWKATGKDREVYGPKGGSNNGQMQLLGMKKTLVFYKGRAPRGLKTRWVMHEYRLLDGHLSSPHPSAKEEEWVICRIFHKGGDKKKNSSLQQQSKHPANVQHPSSPVRGGSLHPPPVPLPGREPMPPQLPSLDNLLSFSNTLLQQSDIVDSLLNHFTSSSPLNTLQHQQFQPCFPPTYPNSAIAVMMDRNMDTNSGPNHHLLPSSLIYKSLASSHQDNISTNGKFQPQPSLTEPAIAIPKKYGETHTSYSGIFQSPPSQYHSNNDNDLNSIVFSPNWLNKVSQLQPPHDQSLLPQPLTLPPPRYHDLNMGLDCSPSGFTADLSSSPNSLEAGWIPLMPGVLASIAQPQI